MVGVHFDTEAHAQHLGLAGGQAGEHGAGSFAQTFSGSGVNGRQGLDVFNEVAQVAVFVITDRGFHGDRFLGDLQYLADLVLGHFHALAQLFRRGLAAHLLQHLTGDAVEFVDGFDHVHRNTDGAGLVRDGAGDGLTNPPCGVGGELVATAILEFVDRLHQADVAFLNQIEELQAAVGVLLGNGDNQTQVGFHHFLLGTAGLGFADGNAAVDFLDVGNVQVHFGLDVGNALLQAHDFVDALGNQRCVGLLALGHLFGPVQAGFVAGERLDEILARHLALTHTDFHDRTLVLAHQIVGGANHVYKLIKGLVAQLERRKHLSQLVQGFLGFLVATAVFGQASVRGVEFFFQ